MKNKKEGDQFHDLPPFFTTQSKDGELYQDYTH